MTYKQQYIRCVRCSQEWISSHCSIPGNEAADILEKESGRLLQTDMSMPYKEAKPMIKITFMNKWTKWTPTDFTEMSK